MTKSQQNKNQQYFDFKDEGKKEAIVFFDNKTAPKYWQVIYDVLMYRSKAFFSTIILCSLIFTLPSIIEPLTTHITPILKEHSSKNETIKAKLTEDKKKLLSELDTQKIRQELQSIREPYDHIYSQAQPFFNKLSTFNSEQNMATNNHDRFNNDFQSRFENVFKTMSVLEANTDSAYETITHEQILDAIKVLRQEKISNFSLSHRSYNEMLYIVQKYKK